MKLRCSRYSPALQQLYSAMQSLDAKELSAAIERAEAATQATATLRRAKRRLEEVRSLDPRAHRARE